MYKILSLDGGGSWSILQLLTLQDKYPGQSGHEILRNYDMVIANSGGSIVLAALVENWQISKALTLFDDQTIREQIFSKNSFMERFFPADYLIKFIGPKYSSKRKGEAFRAIFPECDKRQMDALPRFIGKPDLKIIVSTFDALNNRAKFFRSYGSGTYFDSVRLTQAIHGSSNAPIDYFDFPARFKAKNTKVFYELWDGALGGFNNPLVAGIIESIKCGIAKDTISIVSIGTSNKLMSVKEKDRFYQVKQISIKERRFKLKFWRLKYQTEFFKKSIVNQAKTILYEPPDWANYVAYMFLFGHAYQHGVGTNLSRFVRLSPLIHVDSQTPPATVALLEVLYGLDMNLTSDADIQKVKNCFTAWKVGNIPNQPIEYLVERNNDLVISIGHPTYNDAYKDWK